jgi:alginate O-acetyltransferase complex protein AlgI
MLFNSGVFLKFFAGFLLLYWLVRNNLRARNILILISSYVFYGWWDYRFLALLIFSSAVDFAVALKIASSATPRARKTWLGASIVVNLTILGFFKYFDFFVTSLGELLESLGVPYRAQTLGIILPVGISFYTFQAMSYTIDVYRGHVAPSRDPVNFLAYVAFFPQLVAGPIERASHLLPQFERTLRITRPMLEEGVWLMLWGMFKKVVIADNLDPLVRMVYPDPGAVVIFTGPAVMLATLAFAVQIYCDFSGYSDIARGTARVLGFDIMWNFNIPYAAASITDFWRRWHISLSTWLRDYLYISLGGNRRGPARTYVNLLVTMLLGGLWHGAAWNYVLWGLWHGLGLVAHRAVAGNRKRSGVAGELPKLQDATGRVQDATTPSAPGWRRGVAWLVTMLFVLYGWLLFRARSIDQIVAMTRSLADFSASLWIGNFVLHIAVFSLPLVLMELWQLRSRNILAPLTLTPWVRAALQAALFLAIILFWERSETPFIYFQF